MAHQFDLENRFERFAKDARNFIHTVPSSVEKGVYGPQLLDCSSSAGANYLEGNESLTKREKVHRFGISRKESKEARHFLRLFEGCGGDEKERKRLEKEADELTRIMGAILGKFGV